MDQSLTRPRVVLVNRAIILNEFKQILLIQRSTEQGHNAGLWEAPGGKLEEGQDISHALEREVLEETGLLILPIQRTAYFESELLTKGKFAGLPYITLVAIAKIDGERTCRLSSEHVAAKWVSYKEALGIPLTTETEKAILALKSYLV